MQMIPKRAGPDDIRTRYGERNPDLLQTTQLVREDKLGSMTIKSCDRVRDTPI